MSELTCNNCSHRLIDGDEIGCLAEIVKDGRLIRCRCYNHTNPGSSAIGPMHTHECGHESCNIIVLSHLLTKISEN